MDKIDLHFMRHAKADKAGRDQDRRLNASGLAQTEEARRKFAELPFDLMLVSPAARCRRTAELVVGDGVPMVEIPSMYPDPAKSQAAVVLDRVFQEVGYAPLSEWLKTAHDVVVEYADHTARRVLEILQQRKPHRVLIVGHAVLLQAIAWRLLAMVAIGDVYFNFLYGELAEAESFHMTVSKIQ